MSITAEKFEDFVERSGLVEREEKVTATKFG